MDIDVNQLANSLNNRADRDLNNLSQSGKENITGLCMPDYSAKVTITTTTYTAPSNGYVWYRNNSIQGMTVTVGGIEWYTGTISGTSGTAIFPISKGETSVASTLSGVVAYFIPLKGA